MNGLKFRGRPPILLAETVKDVVHLDNPYATAIMDRSHPLTSELVGAVLGQSVFNWEGRNPSPAFDEDGDFVGTDLDLLSFMMPMAARGAVIEIPRYANRRKVVVRAGERRVGATHFGKVTGLISNQDVFSFSVRIFDRSVVKRDAATGEEDTGASRNHMLVDCDGYWYHGWDKIKWNPTAEENRFLTEKKLWTGNTVSFRHYVHPARWQSIFGAPYLLLKMLVARLDDEARFYRAEVKRVEARGVELPVGEKVGYVPSVYEGEVKSIRVSTMEVVLDLPEFSGTYGLVTETSDGVIGAYRRQKLLTWTVKPAVQFMVRADEAAYFRYGNSQVASWMGSRRWNSGWRAPRGRVDWNQMTLSNDVSLRLRKKEIAQQVSAE